MNVLDALKRRRTVRKFKQEALDRKCIVKMIDMARLSPSAGNMQSLKYCIVDLKEERNAIFKHTKYAGYIPNWNPEFSESPVAYIVVLNDKTIRTTDSLIQCDCGLAMMAISLAAFEMGIDSCILGAINRKEIAQILNIDSKYEILYIIGLGKSSQTNVQVDDNFNVKYVLDEKGNFTVPKRNLENVILAERE